MMGNTPNTERVRTGTPCRVDLVSSDVYKVTRSYGFLFVWNTV